MKIQERDPRRVVLLNVQSQEPDEDDPYKDYVVPDDLMCSPHPECRLTA